MKNLNYEHQSIKVGGCWGSWRVCGWRVHGVDGVGVGGWSVHGVSGCLVVWVVVGWVVGELMGWVHITTHP